jgi:1,4-dihydroxy-2-naphthoyl-CoA hydrolase
MESHRFVYQRTIRFQDTDAAGVVYFANVLAICHEAYEASLADAGINLRDFFGGSAIAVPIVHAEVDFMQPMFCGERYTIQIQPTQLSDSKFEIVYQIVPVETVESIVSRASTVHVAIDAATRRRTDLPVPLVQWLQSWRSN